MVNPEIVLNLWYVHDDAGFLYSLRARAYVGTGTDDEKLAMLDSLANVDYLIARPFPIPDRFHLEVEEEGKRRRLPVAPREFLNGLDSPIALWEDAIKELTAELPAQTALSIPEAPLFSSTALLANDSGRLFSGRQRIRLCRNGEAVEVMEPTWALIVAFIADHGWSPSEPTDSFLSSDDHSMAEADALALAAAGRETFSQILKAPRSVQVRFELEKLAEIVDFASGGGFKISRQR